MGRISDICAGRGRGARTRGSKARRGSRMVDTFGSTCRRLRQIIEYVACNDVISLGRDFGMGIGRILIWSKYKVCSTLDNLRLLLKVLGQ
jgi:hypothetical protein